MTITLTLTPEQEARLLERAARAGRDPDTLTLQAVTDWLETPPSSLSREELGQQIDAAYADGPDDEEQQFMQAGLRHMARMAAREKW